MECLMCFNLNHDRLLLLSELLKKLGLRLKLPRRLLRRP
jgi:hypothetical protein